MTDRNDSADLGIAARIRRSRGRGARIYPVTSKLTREEHDILSAAAKREGKALGEWARDALLACATRGSAEGPLFTELLALRLFLNGVLRELALGRQMTEKQFEAHLAEAKKNKHQIARDVLGQYQPNTEGDK